METNLKDVYSRVTSQIIAAMEAGAPDYRMPWHISSAGCGQPANALTRRRYQGVNVLTLWAAAQSQDYPTGWWATYNQWQQLGAKVRAGEKSSLIVVWKEVPRKEEADPMGGDDERDAEKQRKGRILLARGYRVFNAAQVDGFRSDDRPPQAEDARIEHAEQFFDRLGATIKHQGDRAFYRIGEDVIYLPPFGVFRSPLDYYSTLAHEMTHWTGAADRLNRQLANRFGSEAYAMEELIAELGAAFVCAQLEIANKPRIDHASYLKIWLEVLRRDNRAIFVAAAKAQQAAEWLADRAHVAAKTAA